jgi:hypothetical protein
MRKLETDALSPIEQPPPLLTASSDSSVLGASTVSVSPRKPLLLTGDHILGGQEEPSAPSERGENSGVRERDASGTLGNQGQTTKMIPLNREDETSLDIETDQFRIHVTRYGDTLQSLAQTYFGTTSFYLDIYLANQDVLSSPINLPVGVALKIPEYTTSIKRDR